MRRGFVRDTMIAKLVNKWMRRNHGCTQQLQRSGNGVVRRLIVVAVCGAVLLGSCPSRAQAQYGRKKETVRRTIPEDQRPWAGKPWLAGILLALATLAVAAKNAKRGHMD
jgi:hypothetical protein